MHMVAVCDDGGFNLGSRIGEDVVVVEDRANVVAKSDDPQTISLFPQDSEGPDQDTEVTHYNAGAACCATTEAYARS